jgi:transposase
MDIDDREVSASGLADANQAGGKRRRWPAALKRELVAALSEPGASVSIVARRYNVNTNQLFKWRRQLDAASNGAPMESVRMLPVAITPASVVVAEARDARSSGGSTATTGSIEIALRGGTRVRIKGAVDPAAVAAAVGAVMAARRRG